MASATTYHRPRLRPLTPVITCFNGSARGVTTRDPLSTSCWYIMRSTNVPKSVRQRLNASNHCSLRPLFAPDLPLPLYVLLLVSARSKLKRSNTHANHSLLNPTHFHSLKTCIFDPLYILPLFPSVFNPPRIPPRLFGSTLIIQKWLRCVFLAFQWRSDLNWVVSWSLSKRWLLLFLLVLTCSLRFPLLSLSSFLSRYRPP